MHHYAEIIPPVVVIKTNTALIPELTVIRREKCPSSYSCRVTIDQDEQISDRRKYALNLFLHQANGWISDADGQAVASFSLLMSL